ncbi:MAG: hypothetical protein US81_C0008G0009 [Parcubacteria group bacterium GW2011_GWE2_38_18]|nr:MAG: hypothetical protein US81_C0008G0009 [Parcubacteria group bacterium GW2011_GWE2_38_18]
MNNKPIKLKKLNKRLKAIYGGRSDLLFHGWHHIDFVTRKATEFAGLEKADLFLVEAAALTHDLNFVVKINSEVRAGKKLRTQLLQDSGFDLVETKRIEEIINEAHTATRGKKISLEGKCLSDADSLFKVLPITPMMFTSKYIQENKVDIKILASKILTEQKKLLKNNIYFYTKAANKYLGWARVNLQLWENVQDSLKDPDVRELLKQAKL